MLATKSWLPDTGNDVLLAILIKSLFGVSRWGHSILGVLGFASLGFVLVFSCYFILGVVVLGF